MTDTRIGDLVGRRIGVYDIKEQVGKGGMGAVYRAHDRSLDRDVALKVLLPSLSSDPEFEKRFVREARAAARLDHPNIVQVYTAGRFEDTLFIAMQFVRGKTLTEVQAERQGPFAPEEALRIVRQAADALEAAHKVGLVHRDIKPTNVMVECAVPHPACGAEAAPPAGQGPASRAPASAGMRNAEGGRRVKIMDFGLMRSSASVERITQTGVFFGTPEYASPEQCETSHVDGRSDIYSLGAVLYEMLTGRVPHVAETPLALFKKISEEDPADVSDLNPRVPKAVASIVRRMLARDREARYASCGALIEDIDRVLGGEPLIRPARRRASRAAGLAWAACAAAVLAGLLAWVLASRPPAAVRLPAEARTAVVVFDFKNGTGREDEQWLEIALSDMMICALSQHDFLSVPTRDQLLWKVQDMALGDRVRDEHRRRLVAEFGAHAYVTGTFYVKDGRVRVTATCYRTADNAPAFAPMGFERPTSELFAVVDDLAGAVSRGIQGGAGRALASTGEGRPVKSCQELELAWAAPRRDVPSLEVRGAADRAKDAPVTAAEHERAGRVEKRKGALEEKLEEKYFRNRPDADTLRHWYQTVRSIEKSGCDAGEYQTLVADLGKQFLSGDGAALQRTVENVQSCAKQIAEAKRQGVLRLGRENIEYVCGACEGVAEASPGACPKCKGALEMHLKLTRKKP